ncbi:MAG: amino acid ABC transporter substrate-binding protein [bacterium]|nr:amino acid ABC transporter substrate-binding protein [bacterium]
MQQIIRRSFVALATLALIVAFVGVMSTRASAVSKLAEVQSTKTLKIGWAEWNPLEYRDVGSNELKGMLIDLGKRIAAKIGAKPVFVEDNWATLASGVAAGKFQIALEGITSERERLVDFSHPLYYSEFTAIVHKDSPYRSWDDINKSNVAISVTTGSSCDQVLGELEKAGKVKARIVRIKDVGPGVLALATGQVQAYTDQKDALLSVLASHPEFALVSGSYSAAQFGVAIPRGQPELKSAIDKAVIGMLKDGTIRALLRQYHVVGNDPASVR